MILAILLLSLPTLWEIFNDRQGDLNKFEDVFIRAGLMLGSAAGCALLGFNFWWSLNLSVAIFFLFFDYLIVMILNRNVYEVKVNWFTHVGKSSVFDQLKFWRTANPWLRFAIKAVYFAVSLLIFVIKSTLDL